MHIVAERKSQNEPTLERLSAGPRGLRKAAARPRGAPLIILRTTDNGRPRSAPIDRGPSAHRHGLTFFLAAAILSRDCRKSNHARIFRGLLYYHRSVVPSRDYRISYTRKNVLSPNTNDNSHQCDQSLVSKIRASSPLVLIVARNQFSIKGLLLEFCYLTYCTVFFSLVPNPPQQSKVAAFESN